MQEALARIEASADAQRAETRVVVDTRWLGGRASDAWARLVESDPTSAAQLKADLGEEPTPETVRQYASDVQSAAPEVWETLVSIADDLGEWGLLRDVALRYAAADGADRVRGLAWAAGAANLAGDVEARDEFLREAREVDARHPSLLMVEARITPDPRERLRILDLIDSLDDRQRVAVEAARAHALYEAGDLDAAFVAVRRAKAIEKDDLLASEVEAALLVEDARAGKGLTWMNASIAVDDLSRVRDRVRQSRRFDLSVELAGKIAQVYLLFGGGPHDIKGVASGLMPEERRRDESAQLAAACSPSTMQTPPRAW